jgi:hypothetical protein
MAFALEEQARLLLDPRSRVRRDDAAGFTSCCGLVSRSVPLRTPPLDDARGPHYRGPWHLPEPDFHRLAALSLSLSYVTTTSLSSWRPSCWTHSSNAGYPGHRAAAIYMPIWRGLRHALTRRSVLSLGAAVPCLRSVGGVACATPRRLLPRAARRQRGTDVRDVASRATAARPGGWRTDRLGS